MPSDLPRIARELGADERTLRRAADRGTLRCSRPSPRRLDVDPREREYLRGHWGLLSALSRALRTEPNVGLAVLYGSTARGDSGAGSDVDLLVRLRDDLPGASADLAVRLEQALGRDVDIARLDRAREGSPLLVLQALDEGRVIVDRDGEWPGLLATRAQLARAARRRGDADLVAVAASYSELVGAPY